MAALGAGAAWAQEYPIRSPGAAASAPVHLTEPITGLVEVVNRPPVQDVQVVGGSLDQPLAVQGEVGLRLSGPLPVELVNPPAPPTLTLDGPVAVSVDQLLRVWVENSPLAPPVVAPPPPRYAAFAFAGVFEAKQSVQRRSFAPPTGTEFLLTDLTLDTRPDALLTVRVMVSPGAVAGTVTGAGDGDLAVLVLDARHGPSVRLATPVPLGGPFTVQVTSEGPGQGAPFTVLAAGTVRDAAGPAP
ncbi:MAG TPA: hypothetical protein VK997_07790 [Deferrisomatales bacterium]|nr:hypothetical protein [Deferrisomatales bacterium]